MRALLATPICLLAVIATVATASSAELSATGISIPFFNDAGKLTHRMLARSGIKTGAARYLRGIEIHYFAPTDPNTIVQKLEAAEATWDEKRETLFGAGPIVVATVDNRLTGDGFDFALATSLLHIHRNFSMSNREVLLTSDRATIELVVDQKGENVKVQDVKRCEAVGNLHIVVQPTAQKKYRFKEAFSEVALYDGATQIVSLPRPTRTLQTDGGEGRFETLTVDLREEDKKEKRP